MKSIVLVVEDQPDIRKLIRMTLDFGEFEVHEAENGVSGLRMLGAVRPNIVLLDVMMPGELDGFQVCRKIKEARETAGTMVVMLTARGQQADLNAGRDAGADAYLTKPFSPLELIDKVESLLEQQARETV
ncbi:response regulator [Zoogloea sp.]|jgi:DNA-binding response OmpR family regulator|uniref:response regulator transcription factor n=1 Tax=Zoogloea sp. TaxID=49181 RepID=UPI002618A761|nr:response regulator [Zoogloea sp.]